jgi:N-acetylmuramoyl-L-alanine amidase
MRQLSIFIFSLAVIVSNSFTSIKAAPDGIRTVVIDAGHGGKDPGALGKNSREKDIALSVALKTGEYINKYFPQVKVVYTRDKDVFIPLDERAKIANKEEADLFISIHCNAIGSKNAWGAETYVMGLHKTEANLAVAKTENAALLLEANHAETYDGFNPNSDEDYITLSMFQSAYLDQSTNVAQKIQDQFRTRVGRHDRGVKQAGFWVLYKTAMPGVLVELGFLSNPKEEKFLLSQNGQTYLASAIYRAFKDYKNEFEAELGEAPFEEINTLKKPTEAATKTVENKAEETSAVSAEPIKAKAEEKTEIAAQKVKTKKEAEYELFFSVQFAASAKKKNMPAFKGISGEINFYEDNGRYKYHSGHFNNINDAINYKNKIRKAGYKDAFVISFQNGQRIPTKKALELLKKKK